MDANAIAGEAARLLMPYLEQIASKPGKTIEIHQDIADNQGQAVGMEANVSGPLSVVTNSLNINLPGAPEQVQALWDLILARAEGKPAAKGAAQELVEAPGDEDNQQAFILQLKKLIKEDEAFSGRLAELLRDAAGPGASVVNRGSGAVATGGGVAAGAGGIAIGGNVGGSVVFGSNNRINSGGSQR